MKIKLFYALIAVVIGIGICGSVWLLLREHSASKQYSGGITDTQNALLSSHTLHGNQVKKTLPPAERKVLDIKNYLMSIYSEEQLATPRMQKWLKVIDSPEALEYMENDPNLRDLSNFLESQGIKISWEEVFDKMFREHFPTGTPEDYESAMRLKVAKQFTEAAPVDLADPKAAALQRINVLIELIEKDKATTTWFVRRFGQDWDAALQVDMEATEHNAALSWLSDVQTNADSIVATEASPQAPHTPKTRDSASAWDMSSITESPKTSDSLPEVPTTADTSGSRLMTDAAIEKSLTPQTPDMPTNKSPDTLAESQSNLEVTLKSQFSSERFERAMSTWKRYGPAEGLRRLKESDPEIAKQIEQHRKREEVPQ